MRQATAGGAEGKSPAGTTRKEQESEVNTVYMLLLLLMMLKLLFCFVLFCVFFFHFAEHKSQHVARCRRTEK